jgi:hypothetical protein
MLGRERATDAPAPMYNLEDLTLGDMAQASTRLRKLGVGARSLEDASQRVARFLFDEFGVPSSNERGSVLVRVYKTHPFGELPPNLQDFAARSTPSRPSAQVPCLVLFGTVGIESTWNFRRRSARHQAIALPSVEAVSELPMVAQLVSQLGFDVASLVSGNPNMVLDRDERTFNVFHVPAALGCPHIPAQDFVRQHGVKSVLGFGGRLPDGQMYAVILFSRLPISRDTANTFKPLALAVKLSLLPFVSTAATFEEESRVEPAV